MTEQKTVTLTRTTLDAVYPATELSVPRQLSNVRLLREIGRGGMGVVWLGRDDLLHRDVAVKFLVSAVAGPDDPGFVQFIAGARAAATVRHPGLTTIHHADLVAGIPYVVMEYIAGPSLHDVRKRCGPLPLPAVLAVLDTVADALGELHERGIVHQDVKPANVLLSDDGHAFVTDFGLAHVRCAAQRDDYTGPIAGTPAYMAPEMHTGHASARSDVYALAIMTYELLCGEVPFTGNVEEMRDHHRVTPLPIAQLAAHGATPGMREVLERAAHKDAVYRDKTARHFLRALQSNCPEWPAPAAGARRLATLVTRCRTAPEAGSRTASGNTPSSYYQTIAARAAAKRSETPTPPSPPRDDPFASVDAPAQPAVDHATRDVSCARCGSSLRSVAPTGACPECGEVVAESHRPDRLIFADRTWIRTLARGQMLLLIGAVLAIVRGPILAAGLYLATFSSVLPTWAGLILDLIVNLAATALLVTGVFLSVSPKRAQYLTPIQSIWLWTTRTGAGTWALLAVVDALRRLADPALSQAPQPGGPLDEMARGLALFWYIFAFATAGGAWFFLVDVAARQPNLPLASSLRGGARLLMFLAVLLMVSALGPAQALPPTAWVGLVGLVALTYGLLILRTTLRVRRMLLDILAIG